jgi:hypothetical protein
MLKIGFNSWYYYFIDNIFEEKMSDIEKAYGGLVPATLLINNKTLINSVVIEYKSIFL